MHKKNCVKITKNWVKITRCDSYSILFNLCGSPCFYHRNQNQKNKCTFFSIFPLRLFWLKKVHFISLFYTKLGRKLVSEKWNKSWNSPGKVLEFCFPISVRTLVPLFKLQNYSGGKFQRWKGNYEFSTLSLLAVILSSANNLWKQFGPRSGPTEC